MPGEGGSADTELLRATAPPSQDYPIPPRAQVTQVDPAKAPSGKRGSVSLSLRLLTLILPVLGTHSALNDDKY